MTRATDMGFAVAGIAAETIAHEGYGLIQVYGYHSAVRMRAGTGLNDGSVGQPIALPVSAAFCLETYASSTATTAVGVFPCAFLLGAYSSFTTSTVAAFLKCL